MNTNKMTENQKIKLEILKIAHQKVKAKMEEPTYLTEAHKKNSEAVMKEISESKKLEIDWEKESERQKWNSKNHSQDTN